MELPIFQDNLKSSGGWAERVSQARAAWDRWLELPEGLALRDQRVQRLELRAIGGGGVPPSTEDLWKDERSSLLLEDRFREATTRIREWAREPGVVFGSGQLLEVYRLVDGRPTDLPLWRTELPPLLSPLHDPVPAVLLPRMVDLAFDWFATEGFEEMHPLEQATVVFLRLLDLHPFESPIRTKQTALLAAGFYTQRAGLPPLIIDPGDPEVTTQFDQALEAAFRMLTQPLIELFTDVTLRTIKQVGDPEVV
jgi:hypothetical protein